MNPVVDTLEGGMAVDADKLKAGRFRVEQEDHVVGVRGRRSSAMARSGEPVAGGAGQRTDASGDPSDKPKYDVTTSGLSKGRGGSRRTAEALRSEAMHGWGPTRS